MPNPWTELLNGNNTALADAFRVDPGTVHAWKHGKSHPSATMTMKITRLFPGIEPNHIQEHWENAQNAAPEPSASAGGAIGDKPTKEATDAKD